MYTLTRVEGDRRGEVVLYALSTCVWCKKTKQLLTDMKVEYSYIFVDQLDRKTRDEVEEEIMKWNPRCSFPTIVLNKQKCIVGYQEADIKGALGL
ncbi:MAG: glutaredoxin family protein [Candidatus Thermoplasmatota archaeon]|jgi:glutaredoxin|nr:glutaredoxin family protein [Candidatus Thermoplasmatota archaeon]